MVQIKKIFIIICFLAIISGCSYNNTVNTNYSQTITPKPLATIPANEIKELDGIKYRIISDDYVEKELDLTEENCPEFVLAEKDPETGNYDALKATKMGLKLNTVEKYKNEIGKSFGAVNTAEDAFRTAIEIINMYYEEKDHCIQYEQPFYICYNKTADAWIISGTLNLSKEPVPPGIPTGSVSLALEKETGILLMLSHSI